MKQEEEKSNTIISNLVNKYGLKSVVFENTEKNFRTFKEEMRDLVKAQKENARKGCPDMPFDYRDVGQFQFELLFGSDILVFILHTNVFEFDRSHEVRRTSYIVEENSRSYCGVIKIYNFLSDSFKYDRLNDIGYLVARIFINKENHYYIEG
ncbi:MAG: hypothetical protein KKA07_00865, partial [Bacteroidetes bacterium]|nr:hypothetical protein [Bacteroidota bacterium]